MTAIPGPEGAWLFDLIFECLCFHNHNHLFILVSSTEFLNQFGQGADSLKLTAIGDYDCEILFRDNTHSDMRFSIPMSLFKALADTDVNFGGRRKFFEFKPCTPPYVINVNS